MVHDAVTTMDYYYAHDHLYSPVALLDDAGTVLERYEYDAYGRRHVFDGDFEPQSASSYGLPIAFTGQRLDTLDSGDLEVMYYKNRYYDNETGRFLTRDPIGYADGINLYEYVRSQPLLMMDTYGLLSASNIADCKDAANELYKELEPSIYDLYQRQSHLLFYLNSLHPEGSKYPPPNNLINLYNERNELLNAMSNLSYYFAWMYRCGCPNTCCNVRFRLKHKIGPHMKELITVLGKIPDPFSPIPISRGKNGFPLIPDETGQGTQWTGDVVTQIGIDQVNKIMKLSDDLVENCAKSGEGSNQPDKYHLITKNGHIQWEKAFVFDRRRHNEWWRHMNESGEWINYPGYVRWHNGQWIWITDLEGMSNGFQCK